MKTERLILATKASGLTGVPHGFHPMPEGTIVEHLSRGGLWLGPRGQLETDDSFLQIIPYVVLTHLDSVLCYRRVPAAGSEARLHGQASIGLGGHVELSDVMHDGSINLLPTLRRTAEREVLEEVGRVAIGMRWVGLVRETDTEIGMVHVGVVAHWEVNDRRTWLAHELTDVEFITPKQARSTDRLERWSSLIVPSLGVDVIQNRIIFPHCNRPALPLQHS